MDDIWLLVCVGAAAIATLELLLLNRQRRLLLLDAGRRRFFVRRQEGTPFDVVQDRRGVEAAPYGIEGARSHQHASQEKDVPGPPKAVGDPQPPARRLTEAALLYVDSEGRCTAANEAARRLLHGPAEECRLTDVFSGSGEDLASLLDRVMRQAVVQRYPAVLAGPSAIPVEISAIALRDRDSNFWGAALLIGMRDSGITLGDSAAALSPQRSSTRPRRAASARP
jgi:hypothetical protein